MASDRNASFRTESQGKTPAAETLHCQNQEPAFATVRVGRPAPEPILAVGGELKSTICLLVDDRAVQSESLGQLSDAQTYRRFLATIERIKTQFDVAPKVIACDMHPDYAATRYAMSQPGTILPVQHHHAHIVSCMTDNNLTGPVIGIACDGTGYGTDGAIWGCEILACDEGGFERAGHLQYFGLLGGDAAAQETWRPAAGVLYETYGEEWQPAASHVLSRVSEEALRIAGQRFTRSTHVPRTSSLGRLFDAVAFLLSVCDRNEQEAQAAIALETWARQQEKTEPLSFALEKSQNAGEPTTMDIRPMIRELIDQTKAGRPAGELARAFHATVAAMLADCANEAAAAQGVNRVLLTGGCFMNQLLRDGVTERLLAAGREVLNHHQVPVSDVGLALGQAVVAAELLRRRSSCV